MGIFPRMGQRSKILLPIRTNLSEYNEIPELTAIGANTSIPSVQDGPTVVQRYRNLAIAAGTTLTTQYRCCGLVLVVDGDLTVNGTISMTARGANFNPTGDHRIRNVLLPGNDILYEIDIPATADEIAAFLAKEKRRFHSLDELPTIYRPTLYCRGPHGGVYAPADLGVIPAIGGAGGAQRIGTGVGNAGASGTERRCGGGGSGGAAGSSAVGGAGGAGTCYSGGSGGGGARGVTGGAAAAHGGAGGAGAGSDSWGGAGNPAGASTGGVGTPSQNGTGGLLIIICTGDITIAGSLTASGSNGGGAFEHSGGGGSGGGSINIFYGGILTNNGSIVVNGGTSPTSNYAGGNGGAGCVTIDHYNF